MGRQKERCREDIPWVYLRAADSIVSRTFLVLLLAYPVACTVGLERLISSLSSLLLLAMVVEVRI